MENHWLVTSFVWLLILVQWASVLCDFLCLPDSWKLYRRSNAVRLFYEKWVNEKWH